MFYFKWINSMVCKRHHPFTFGSKWAYCKIKGEKASYSQIFRNYVHASPGFPCAKGGEEEEERGGHFWVGGLVDAICTSIHLSPRVFGVEVILRFALQLLRVGTT